MQILLFQRIRLSRFRIDLIRLFLWREPDQLQDPDLELLLDPDVILLEPWILILQLPKSLVLSLHPGMHKSHL